MRNHRTPRARCSWGLLRAAVAPLAVALFVRVEVGAFAQFATEPKPGESGTGPFRANAAGLDLFDAIARGKVEATLSLDNSRGGKLWLHNPGTQEITVRLPEAFAASPKQSPAYDNPPQSVGGGLLPVDESAGDDDRRRLGEPPVGRRVTVPPEGSSDLRVVTVCLDPELPPPSPGVEYDIRPISDVTNNPAVAELCRMLAEPHTDQRAAQAAAWHLHNGIGWGLMAAWRSPRPGATFQPQYFTARQIRLGKRLAEAAVREARKRLEESRGRGR